MQSKRVAVLEAWAIAHNPQGWTKLAAAAEISPGTLRKILKDDHKPSVEIALRVAQVVNKTVDELWGTDISDGELPPAA